MATVTTREYNPTTGSLIGNITSFSFGRVPVGTTSRVKVVDFAFTGVTSVSNVKLGLVSSGTTNVNPSPDDIQEDGSAGNGYFGIEHSTTFDSSKTSGSLSRHFAGLNTSGTSADPKNVTIGTRDDVLSQYVYLDIELSANDTGEKSGVYKVFFDFE